MRIHPDSKLHFFVYDNPNGDFHDIRLESYLEIPQNGGESSFKRTESIRLHCHKDLNRFECVSFQMDFGKHDCMYSGHRDYKSLVKDLTFDSCIRSYKVVNLEEYIKAREKVLGIYNNRACIDYDTLKPGTEY